MLFRSPEGVTAEIVKMAKATQDPSLGNSSVHLAMNAMLSKESKAVFFQTIKMEAISMLSDKIKSEAWGYIENRVPALKMVNEKISTGLELMDNIKKGKELVSKKDESLFSAMIQDKINEMERIIQPVKPLPEALLNVMSFFNVAKPADN